MFKRHVSGVVTEPLYEQPDGGNSGSGSGGTGSNPGSASSTRKPAISFESQEELDEVINARLARAERTWAAKNGFDPKDREDLERLRKAELDAARAREEAKGNYDRALEQVNSEFGTKLSEKDKFINNLTGELRTERCRNKIVSAAVSAGAFKPDQIADLLERRVQLDDGFQPVVLGPDGKQMFVKGRPATVEELVSSYLQENTHLVQSTGGGNPSGSASARGGSSTSDRGQDGVDPSVEELEAKYKQAQVQAQQSRDPRDITRAHRFRKQLDEALAKSRAS